MKTFTTLPLENLCGKARSHLVYLPVQFSGNHWLQQPVVQAFLGLQQQAKKAGFNLQPASSFRDFQRQLIIWNTKFNGERKVHNDQGQALDLTILLPWEKCQAILRWSALPGASRHHWGTEIDIFDPNLLPQNQTLQLEPWEYEKGGYFFELSQFLAETLVQFDFYLPFSHLTEEKQIGYEPWHISYLPLAQHYQHQLTAEILLNAWQNEPLQGKEILEKNIKQIFYHYIL
ncbi:peptidase M15 [Mergibacter septicus]|uniref:M15 family metallopeptidase n=1 Tax=Mergibacter septicus TaxID=221402 RepID=UPI0011793C3A|nr:M15 family metallopeptidase [Mergibacter septicus]AWX13601.1 peptidase M15 [Mergibacter septicus]